MTETGKKLKNLERLVLKVEGLDTSKPDYYTQLYTNLMVLAIYRNRKQTVQKLKNIYEKPAKFTDGDILNMSALQNYANFMKNKTTRGGLKVEPILIELEIQMKLIYYDLIQDLDIDMIKTGVNLKKVNIL